jgi:hypothetical protein
MTNGYKRVWSFFGNGHGKGPHDGVNAIIKRFIQKTQLDVDGVRLQNVEEVYNSYVNICHTD